MPKWENRMNNRMPPEYAMPAWAAPQVGRRFGRNLGSWVGYKGRATTHPMPMRTCTKCSKQFTQQSNLKQHMLIHIGAKPFPCADCKSAFTTKQCLQRHYVKIHHFNETNIPAIQKVNLDELLNELLNNKKPTNSVDDYVGLPPLTPIPKVRYTFFW